MEFAEKYRSVAAEAMGNPVLQGALANLQQRLGQGALAAYQQLPEGPGLRNVAHALRMEAVENLDHLLGRLAAQVRAHGGHVFFADDGRAATDYCLDLVRRHGVRLAVKGKSMVTEEIALNTALQAAGVEMCETDLGEYIIQLAGEHPSHIIAPAIHKTRHEIAELFAERLHMVHTTEPPRLTLAARQALREKFVRADLGISGCNMACAETGHITTVSNEGNIRMSTTLPRVYVAVMGMEKVTARLSDYAVLFRLLPRAAAAQKMATYVSFIGGPRRPGQADGPEELHLIVLDNGRSRILADRCFREILCCIRCAACLNVCPVYAKIGGHAYGSPYSGPVGAVVTPLLSGIVKAKNLCLGETLCGACKAVCPVNIDIPRMLLNLRHILAEGDAGWGVEAQHPVERSVFEWWARLVGHPQGYALAQRFAGWTQRLTLRRRPMIRWLPKPLDGWTNSRDLKPLAAKSFRQRWIEEQRNKPPEAK
jgi:L-lactate dehydrogenase complex protein LldF